MTSALYRSWSGAARTMALAVDAGVDAARTADAPAFAEAMTALANVDREQLAVLLGTLTRELIERSHPDGLDSEDAEQLLQSCIRAAAHWYGGIDSDVLIEAFTGALGVSDPDEVPTFDRAAVVAHGVLLITDQLVLLGLELPPVLDSALGELLRAQTVELP